MDYDFKGQVNVERDLFYNSDSDFGIYAVTITEVIQTSNLLDETFPIEKDMKMVIKGNTAPLNIDEEYYLTAYLENDKRYGYELHIIGMANVIDRIPHDIISKRRVLSKLFTPLQVDEMYEAFDDPYEVFLEGDYTKLVKIKNCGMKTATYLMQKFNDFIPRTQVYLGLSEFNLSNATIDSLLKEYHSADLVIHKVKENPYVLSNLDGFGWKRADNIALKAGGNRFSLSRICSFIEYYLNQRGANGCSFIACSELMTAIEENIGKDVSDFTLSEAIHSIEDELHYNDERTIIGSKRYWNLENAIADEVLRLMNGYACPIGKTRDEIVDIIHRQELEQDWEYTDEQIEAVKLVLENNFVVITGGAGTGKSSVVSLILSILGSNHQIAQVALSGRAAARLSEVTHQPGSTIHRLLGYPKGKPEYGGYFYNQDLQLPQDIIIIDEISMIGGYLFYDLLRAIKTGAKIILLGDPGQLEPIGECNVAHDLLISHIVPQITLNKIHRQAQKSGIVSESIKVRRGIPLIIEGTAGVLVRGDLKDFILDYFSDKHNTFAKVMRYFSDSLAKVPSILDIQVLSPVNTRGDTSNYQLNLALQEIYNPLKWNQPELKIQVNDKPYSIRVGDKVINTDNNYGVRVAYTEDKTTDVFNGNIGIVKEVNLNDKSLIVDFQDIGTVLLDGDAVKHIELAYAVSIHKYQGSECDVVIIALNFDAYKNLSRELVYTAITRAKKQCILVAQNSALSYAVKHSSTRQKQTYLGWILVDRITPKPEKLVF